MAPLPSTSVDFSTKTQAHSTLGTELWENKVAGSTVLTDVKKRKFLHVIDCDWLVVCDFYRGCDIQNVCSNVGGGGKSTSYETFCVAIHASPRS